MYASLHVNKVREETWEKGRGLIRDGCADAMRKAIYCQFEIIVLKRQLT